MMRESVFTAPRRGLLRQCGLIFGALTAVACSRPAGADGPPDITGRWTTLATQIVLHTEQGGDQDRNLTVSEGEWTSKMLRTAPVTTFYPDHSLASWYVMTEDVAANRKGDTLWQRGKWVQKGDSLSLETNASSVGAIWYRVKYTENRMELDATMDMDGDGQVDDTYNAIMRKED